MAGIREISFGRLMLRGIYDIYAGYMKIIMSAHRRAIKSEATARQRIRRVRARIRVDVVIIEIVVWRLGHVTTLARGLVEFDATLSQDNTRRPFIMPRMSRLPPATAIYAVTVCAITPYWQDWRRGAVGNTPDDIIRH